MSSSIPVSIESFNFRLLAKRGLFWPEQKTLFIADTHFGKEATLRRQGIPVPRGSTIGTLATITEMVTECAATRLILLGDMFHARSSLSKDVEDSLDEFFTWHSELQFTLVLGNHDRPIGNLPTRWSIEIVDSGFQIERVAISHIPQLPCGKCDLLLCGHIHPAFRFQSQTESLGKLPCFWLSQRQLVLPAIGEFTGTHVVNPLPNDRTWVIAENQIIEVSNATGKESTTSILRD